MKWTKIKIDNRCPESAVKMDGSICFPQKCARIMFFHLFISVDLGLGHQKHSSCLSAGILPLPKTIDDEQSTRWSGTKTHPYGEVTASKLLSQYEFTAFLSSSKVVKGTPADATGLKLLEAAMRERGRARECLEKILMIFVVF